MEEKDKSCSTHARDFEGPGETSRESRREGERACEEGDYGKKRRWEERRRSIRRIKRRERKEWERRFKEGRRVRVPKRGERDR